MSLKTTGTVVVFLWSVTVFLGQDGGSLENPTQSTCVKVVEKGEPSPGWNVTYTPMSICALKGSTVNLSCSYKYPSGTVTSTFWFTKCNNSLYINLMNDSDYTGRMNYSSNQNNTNTLTITDLRLNDSVRYWFRFLTNQTGGKWTGKHGVTLSVTGLQVDVTSESTPKTLICNTTCTLPCNTTYIWYKNGQHINESTSPQYKYSVYSNYGDSYSCAVKGHEDLHSPVVYGPKKTSVSVSPSGEIVEGSSVTLTCGSDANPPVDKYTWYFKNKLLLNGSGQIYNISNISSEDSGPYICEAHNRIGSQNSTALMIFRSGKVFKIMLFTGENGKQSPVITAAVGVTVFVLVLICFSGFMCFRQGRKTASTSASSQERNTRGTADSGEVGSSLVYEIVSSKDMTSTAAQTANTDNQEDLHYASIHFSSSKNQEVLLYPTNQNLEEDVQYAAVNCTASMLPPSNEDPSMIYSTVDKPRDKRT